MFEVNVQKSLMVYKMSGKRSRDARRKLQKKSLNETMPEDQHANIVIKKTNIHVLFLWNHTARETTQLKG